jgi:hypothetical protein
MATQTRPTGEHPPHPLAIVMNLVMEHVTRPAVSSGGVAVPDGEWQGCADPHCRPFLIEYERDAQGRLLCPACDAPCNSDRAVREHLSESHSVQHERRPRAKGPIECKCGATLAHRNSYLKHVQRGRCAVNRPHKYRRPGELKARR